jgi:hypothetical protein
MGGDGWVSPIRAGQSAGYVLAYSFPSIHVVLSSRRRDPMNQSGAAHRLRDVGESATSRSSIGWWSSSSSALVAEEIPVVLAHRG